MRSIVCGYSCSWAGLRSIVIVIIVVIVIVIGIVIIMVVVIVGQACVP